VQAWYCNVTQKKRHYSNIINLGQWNSYECRLLIVYDCHILNGMDHDSQRPLSSYEIPWDLINEARLRATLLCALNVDAI
jgi:hypothetical protein